MPRKPSSVFLVAEVPGAQPYMPLQAWRVPLSDDNSVEQIVSGYYHTQPIGTRIFAVEDTKMAAFDVQPDITAVADARLQQDE